MGFRTNVGSDSFGNFCTIFLNPADLFPVKCLTFKKSAEEVAAQFGDVVVIMTIH